MAIEHVYFINNTSIVAVWPLRCFVLSHFPCMLSILVS